MTPGPFAILRNLIVFAAAATIVVAVAYVLVLRDGGAPATACRNAATGEERPVSRDSVAADTFQQTWDSIGEQLTAGVSEVTLGFSESEVTSRASVFLEERDAPVDDLVVCFHDGYAEARATVEAPRASGLPLIGGLFDTTARITGTLDLSGEHPRLVITDFDAGRLPGFVEDQLRDHVQDELNKRLERLVIRYAYTSLVFTEGTATITATAVAP